MVDVWNFVSCTFGSHEISDGSLGLASTTVFGGGALDADVSTFRSVMRYFPLQLPTSTVLKKYIDK